MAAELSITIRARDEASKVVNGLADNIMKHQRAIGLGMVAVGAAITGMAAMALKSFASEEVGIARLRVAMRNVNIDYDENKESLEGWIDAMQQKTAIADSEQRDSLASLIRMTGDLDQAQNMLTLAMDVAVGTGKDLATANQLIMYAMGGNWGMVERYIPALKTVQDEEKKWFELRRLFAGQAEEFGKTTAGQMQLLKNNIGDVAEALGGLLVPAMNDFTKAVIPMTQSIKEWTAENEQLAKSLTTGVVVGGGVLLALGAVILVLPTLVAGLAIVGGALATTTGGLIALGAAATAAGVIIHKLIGTENEYGAALKEIDDVRETARLRQLDRWKNMAYIRGADLAAELAAVRENDAKIIDSYDRKVAWIISGNETRKKLQADVDAYLDVKRIEEQSIIDAANVIAEEAERAHQAKLELQWRNYMTVKLKLRNEYIAVEKAAEQALTDWENEQLRIRLFNEGQYGLSLIRMAEQTAASLRAISPWGATTPSFAGWSQASIQAFAEMQNIPAWMRDLRPEPFVLGTPPVPSFASGGTVPGPVGSPQVIVAHGGETVSKAGGDIIIPLMVGGTEIERLIINRITMRARLQGAVL